MSNLAISYTLSFFEKNFSGFHMATGEFMMQFSIAIFARAVLLVSCQLMWILHVIYSETQ